ncbi:hypothetical protein F0562_007853 [Nyssa sinensis]|uniref:RING-type E3 ubiquitin transferase n=1 Tax=Nyssa sinensis TaxID=561372 RepID=A0A5J5A9G8_9ASTE|nr:hypothetical protein F0562_007853 [Nyssa sinensis]
MRPAREAMPPTAAKCDAHACPWWPYSNSKDFKANAAIIVIVLFCALVCVLALNAAIRYFLRCRRRPGYPPETQEVETQPKPSHCAAAASVAVSPTVVFSPGTKLAGAEAECTICLSEFVEGDRIRVLVNCNHGFHIQCIHEWLSSHFSCPTCRASCLSESSSFSSSSNEIAGCQLAASGAESNFPPAATENPRSPEGPLELDPTSKSGSLPFCGMLIVFVPETILRSSSRQGNGKKFSVTEIA